VYPYLANRRFEKGKRSQQFWGWRKKGMRIYFLRLMPKARGIKAGSLIYPLFLSALKILEF
jgi:hypothetical protein